MRKVLKGFTLAEVMIVLTVIGILAGILIPVANNSRPDENVMKFKKPMQHYLMLSMNL